ncbi:MAG: HEAT repeat domain-containing protein [Anaerolineales bacterium]
MERKASAVQQEFIQLSEQLDELGWQIADADEEEKKAIREKQKAIRIEQQQIAEDVNLWRRRAREVTQQPGTISLRSYLNDLLELNEELVTPAVQNALTLMDTPPDERSFPDEEPILTQQTLVGRLLERARTENDLRVSDPAIRMKEAIAFANRAGMAQDEDSIAEVVTAMDDPDPLVRELAIFTTIQVLRFRALRLADLEQAHAAVQQLTQIPHPAVVPVLIEIVEQPRVGYIQEGGESKQADNSRSRMVALLKLVEWHTAEAQIALQKLKFDRDPHIVKAAQRALELFPERWNGEFPGQKNMPDTGG